MAKRRIKKPVRRKKESDYPGEMSFRKALGMNPTYYQEGGKLYYQEDIGKLPVKYVEDSNDPAFIAYKDSFDLAKLTDIQREREGAAKFISFSSMPQSGRDFRNAEKNNLGKNPNAPKGFYNDKDADYVTYNTARQSLNNPRIFISPRGSADIFHPSIDPTSVYFSSKGAANAYYPYPKQQVAIKPSGGTEGYTHQYTYTNPFTGKKEQRVVAKEKVGDQVISKYLNWDQYQKQKESKEYSNFLYQDKRPAIIPKQQGGKLYYQENTGQLPPSTGFNFSGYLDGNQGIIPDYNNIPTKSHISNILLNTPLPVVKPADKPKNKPKKSDVLDLDNSLDYLVNTRGGTRDLWGNMADTIGYHESAHTMDPLQKQIGGGPGRGIFQFEAPSLITAQNRYNRIADRLKLKPDPKILSAKSALELSPEQQYSLFLINLSESKAKLKDYADNKLPLVDLWLQGHKNKEAKRDRESFRTSVQKAKDESIQKGYDSFKQLGGALPKAQVGKLRYARGGSLTSAQDTAQAADLNQDVMRKDIKKASVGEDFMAGLYGVGEGLLDTVTFGLTDELTDAGFKGLQAAAGHDINSDEAKRQAGIAGWGNVAGAVTGAIINPGAIGSAAEEGLEGIGTGIEGIDPSSDIATGIGTSLKGMAGSKVLGGLNDKDKIPEGMQGFSKLFMARNGGRFRYGYRGGGQMLNQNMGLTEIDGPSHEQGGVTLPNSGGRPDVEVEGPETIYTPENYVMSEKMKASKEALEYAGITGKAASRLAGKSYADLSKAIKSKAGDKLRPADPLSKKMLDKEMKRLMMAHEYDREAKRMKDEAMRSQMMGGSNIIAETPEERAGGYNMYPNAESIAFPGNGATSVVPTYNNDPIMVTGADGSQQMLTDEPIETEAPFIEQKMAQGGKMIKRADGSYSKRGLWDNIRANRGSGRKPTKQMLEQEAKIKAAEKAYGGYYADGGSFDNPGFRALPSYVQAKIKSNMALGGDMAGLGMDMETANSMQKGIGNFLKPITQALNNVADIESQNNEYQMQLGGFMGDYIDEDDIMEYGEGGYTVRKSNDRKGKTHVVTGPDGTKKYFGDPNLGERGKSKYGKDAFYARHKKNLDNNPHFRAYARATWEDGGYMNMLDSNVDMVDMETPMYEYGGSMMYGQGGGIHIDPSKRGTFKAQASRMGMGVQQAASSILNAPEGKYSPAMRKKANFARNFAKADGGYMYQMGGEMMAQQPQGQPQGGSGQEEIMQQVAQMLQQGMAPEEIVGQLVQMGVPQEQAIQIVQMIVQQMQGQQQAPQEAPQQAPPMMRGGGYMYQMGGEMAPQQAPQQGGSQEQIMQAIVQMLQQGLQPEQIVGELVKMGIPQEAAIQAVQMVMEQVQQSQGMQQQQQAAPPAEQGMMSQQGAPATMRGGGRMYQMGGSLADNYLAQVNQYPVLKRGGGKLYYQSAGFLPNTTSTLQNMLNDDTVESGVYQDADAIAIGDQANANANINTNANTGIEPILLPRPSLSERGIYLGDATPAGTMLSVNSRFNPNFTMTPQEKTNWLNKTRGYSGLLPDEGYAAINQFENTMGTYDAQGNPIGMGRGDQYAQTGDKDKIEAFIDSSIGRDTWDRLPDDVKTQAYSFMFHTGKYDAALSGLAQAINNSTGGKDLGDQRRGYTRDFSVNAIKRADFSNPYFYDKYLNILGDQYNSIADNTKKFNTGVGVNYAPTLRNRPMSIHNNLYPATSSTPAQSAAAPSNNQSNPRTGVTLNPKIALPSSTPSSTPAGNFQRINPKVYIPGAYTPPTSIGFNAKPPVNMMQPQGVRNNYRRDPSLFKIPLGTPSASTPANNTAPPLDPYESPMGNYIAGGVGSMLGPLANAAAAAFAPDPTYTAAPKLGRYDYTPVALQRAQANQAMANTRQAIRMGAPTQGSYLANVGVALPSAGANYGSQIAQTRYGIDAQNMALANQEASLRAAQADKNALMTDQSIEKRWKLGMEAAAGTGRNIQGFSKDLAAKRMQDMMVNQLRTGDFSSIGYDLVNGKLVPKVAPAGLATYNDGITTLNNGQRIRFNPETEKYELLP